MEGQDLFCDETFDLLAKCFMLFAVIVLTHGFGFGSVVKRLDGQDRYFIVGITNSAPLPIDSGQRCMMLLYRV